jgi:hypothetical protein
MIGKKQRTSIVYLTLTIYFFDDELISLCFYTTLSLTKQKKFVLILRNILKKLKFQNNCDITCNKIK